MLCNVHDQTRKSPFDKDVSISKRKHTYYASKEQRETKSKARIGALIRNETWAAILIKLST